MLQCDAAGEYGALGMFVVKLFVALISAVLLAQPATATHIVQLASSPAACPSGAATCPPATEIFADDDSGMSPGQIVAGLAGLLVLGLVFGRRRSVLPQVVS
ncbi:hypothetical protein [Sandarakinorhabdus sp.]|uniref:hypothetical protein n=1 Tax=Sandarakinorhabdus sp. TaxID=1916663 RepID=UPI00286EA0B7|nr:hypothetical protein [Sandarakinorhabdus sp.]